MAVKVIQYPKFYWTNYNGSIEPQQAGYFPATKDVIDMPPFVTIPVVLGTMAGGVWLVRYSQTLKWHRAFFSFWTALCSIWLLVVTKQVGPPLITASLVVLCGIGYYLLLNHLDPFKRKASQFQSQPNPK